MKSKLKRRQVSLKMLTWYRIRALADTEAYDCFMGDMIARIVDEWCKANDWRFAPASKAPGSQKLLASRHARRARAGKKAVSPIFYD